MYSKEKETSKPKSTNKKEKKNMKNPKYVINRLDLGSRELGYQFSNQRFI